MFVLPAAVAEQELDAVAKGLAAARLILNDGKTRTQYDLDQQRGGAGADVAVVARAGDRNVRGSFAVSAVAGDFAAFALAAVGAGGHFQYRTYATYHAAREGSAGKGGGPTAKVAGASVLGTEAGGSLPIALLIAFLRHPHEVEAEGPRPTRASWIISETASTGRGQLLRSRHHMEKVVKTSVSLQILGRGREIEERQHRQTSRPPRISRTRTTSGGSGGLVEAVRL
ncbi:unnamed protein product [Prorocentrum cordatum]|uniref:Subtilisin n=1 Tax=Prorocentrum cordatum TaxID=2364126 RepID=A0ABN9VKK9_9DINO|nr:unnamed protein product [Polarella glacialis]